MTDLFSVLILGIGSGFGSAFGIELARFLFSKVLKVEKRQVV
jgi:hypothetical protein